MRSILNPMYALTLSVVLALGTGSAVARENMFNRNTFSIAETVQTDQWMPVTGSKTLHQFMTGLKAERILPNGEMSRGEFRGDGTGTLYSWGATFPRTWKIKGDKQVCITEKFATQCYSIERNIVDSELYRVRQLATGKLTEFRVTGGHGVLKAPAKDIGNDGGAATASADELAAELSNPNTAVATLNFKVQYRRFDGAQPGADDQTGYTILFQPVLPFVLDSGAKIIWRPAIPLLIDQPLLNTGNRKFEQETALGDIVFDLAYAPKTEDGRLLAFGFITSLPTASNDLGTDRWTLGPEILIGKITPKHVYGLFPSHQWDIGGSGDKDINLTTIQAFYTCLPGGGWSVGTAPTMTYDWETEQWIIPLQVNVGKTVMLGGRPW